MAKKTFQNEWVFDSFVDHPTFYTKRMFGGLAVYLHGRQVLLLVEPTKNGKWNWNGILVCTSQEYHQDLIQSFPSLAPHEAIKKWLYIDSKVKDFEETLREIAGLIESNDERIGIWPKVK